MKTQSYTWELRPYLGGRCHLTTPHHTTPQSKEEDSTSSEQPYHYISKQL